MTKMESSKSVLTIALLIGVFPVSALADAGTQFRNPSDPVSCESLGAIPIERVFDVGPGISTYTAYDEGVAAGYNSCGYPSNPQLPALPLMGNLNSGFTALALDVCDGDSAFVEEIAPNGALYYYPLVKYKTSNGMDYYKTAYPENSYVGQYVLPFLDTLTLEHAVDDPSKPQASGATLTVNYNGGVYTGTCDNTIGGG